MDLKASEIQTQTPWLIAGAPPPPPPPHLFLPAFIPLSIAKC